MKKSKLFIVVAGLLLGGMLSALAQTAPGPPFRLRQNFFTGLSSPLLVTNAMDGTRRVFIVERGGIIKVAAPASNSTTNFMNITARVLSGGERGLLGLAFHPEFATNSYFFVNYTRQTDGATVISRFRAINNNSVGDTNSERILMTIPQPFSNHNGGMIGFREDRPGEYNLYVGMGDGGSGNDPGNRAQNINDLHGKFLRITPDVSGVDANPPYTVPPDNPYVGVNGLDEIYAIGVRNPWRWSFDRGGANQLYAGDVGQSAIEEVSLITLGGNYGWRVYEGTQCTGIDPGLCNPGNYIMPIFQYNHGAGRCSVTGGYVYRGVQNALNVGTYIYGDYCTGEIWKWENAQQTLMVDTPRNIASFGEDEDGELYVVGLGGTVDKVLGNKTSADFDGDLKTDVGVFRPSDGLWFVLNSGTATATVRQFGTEGDIPVTKDWDGDGIADIAVFRPSTGVWYIFQSSTNTPLIVPFGSAGDIPAVGDYDGDGKADFALFRPSTGIWYVLRSRDLGLTVLQFGSEGDIPTPGDWDGDGWYDVAVWRPSTGVWYRLNSSNGSFGAVQFGSQGDIPAQGDFDGDMKNDFAVFRPSTGLWYILRSSDSGVQIHAWGTEGDIPVVGDYDGDFRDDIAVYRPSTGVWYVLQSSNSILFAVQFGASTDLPIPAYDAP